MTFRQLMLQHPLPTSSTFGWRHLGSTLLGIGTICVLAVLAPVALPVAAQQSTIWRGTGQVVSGQGQGATVQLVLETQGNRIRSQSGPSLDTTFAGGSQTIENAEGTWQIEAKGGRLGVTLYRGEQVIRYHLTPTEAEAASPATEDSE